MDFHNCKDLPVWAQILVNSAPEGKHDHAPESDLGDELQVPDQDAAA